jgi:hypothetical protein
MKFFVLYFLQYLLLSLNPKYSLLYFVLNSVSLLLAYS